MRKESTATVVREEDRDFFERELDSFVPDRVFDAHCHLWNAEHLTADVLQGLKGLPETAGYDEYMTQLRDLLPGRTVAAMFIPFVLHEDKMLAANEWTAAAASRDERCRSSFYIRPTDDPDWVRQQVRRLGSRGMKCYHRWAPVDPTWEADLPHYLPEEIVEVANEEGIAITLHMVKSRAVADPENLRWIRHYCKTYPDMKLILAHSARGFQPSHNFEGLPELVDLDNLYCDCSANCEPIAHESIIRILGHKRLLFGTDFYVSHLRGRSVSVADSFLWLYEETPVWGEKHTTIKPVFAGLEQLRSLKWACWSSRLTDAQIEDIFWNNAAGLLGVD